MSNISAWTCKFQCSNCGGDWSEEIPTKHLVIQEPVGVVVYDFTGNVKKFARLVLCKRCETSLMVVKSQPR